MASGFLISAVASTKKHKGKRTMRLLHNERSLSKFIKTYIDPAKDPIIQVQVFNSNGYLDRTILGKEAIEEFGDH